MTTGNLLRATTAALAAGLALGLPAVPFSPSAFNVAFLSPGPANPSRYVDAMPSGNGDAVILAWGNQTNGSLDLLVRSARAAHSDSALFTLARLQLILSPNPFESGSYWNQTLDLATGTISLLGGGSTFADYAVSLSVYVDANSNTVMAAAAARDGVSNFSLTVTMHSVRPSSRFSYPLDYNCNASSSGPDVIAPALPGLPNSIALYHVNNVAGGDTSFFAETLTQQGLAPLLPSFPDPLDGRIFGLAVTGTTGLDPSGPALQRLSPTQLSSAVPAPAFSVQIAVLIQPDATGDAAAFITALAMQIQSAPASAARAAASAAWWDAFWARSWIVTQAPPPDARVGVFPCGGGDPSMYQRVVLNSSDQTLRLGDGRCFILAAGGGEITAGPCGGPETQWTLVPCDASNCAPGSGSWVRSAVDGRVWDMPGAVCPWIDTFSADNPVGEFKNQLFALNGSDLRCLCAHCEGQCVSVVPPTPGPSTISAAYANTRFLEAVQSRSPGGPPIKFNGMMFQNQMGDNGPNDIDYRQWGSDHWWQNTRLPYGNMAAAGDFEQWRTLLDWLASLLPLARARTRLLLPGEQGVFFTETTTVFGAYQQGEYQCGTRPQGYPLWLENSGWVQYDFLGNAAGGEGSLMALDYFAYTGDLEAAARYIPLATDTLDFFISHYHNRSATGQFMVWPTQVLETYWCSYPGWTDCCVNDLPAVAALQSLTERLLALPESTGLLTPQQRSAYAELQAILPSLPLQPGGAQYAPAEVVSSGAHNAEIPELFGVHPFRLTTKGRAVISNDSALTAIGISTWNSLPLTKNMDGWYYGGLQAALLGMSTQAYADVLHRSQQPPADGFRWPYFAQHYQDYEPSADHFANHNTGLQLMLMQLGEDCVPSCVNQSIVLFPAWPCEHPVNFRLWGPGNTVVNVNYTVAAMEIAVQPPSRTGSVRVANCAPAAGVTMRQPASVMPIAAAAVAVRD